MATLIHFDIPADDTLRAKLFYEQLFAWKIEKFPNGVQEYYLIETTTATGEKGIGGGIAKREHPDQKITNFIQVNSIDETIAKIEKLRGQILEKKTQIPNAGYIASCKDTENNTFGLIESEKHV